MPKSGWRLTGWSVGTMDEEVKYWRKITFIPVHGTCPRPIVPWFQYTIPVELLFNIHCSGTFPVNVMWLLCSVLRFCWLCQIAICKGSLCSFSRWVKFCLLSLHTLLYREAVLQLHYRCGSPLMDSERCWMYKYWWVCMLNNKSDSVDTSEFVTLWFNGCSNNEQWYIWHFDHKGIHQRQNGNICEKRLTYIQQPQRRGFK